MNEATETNGNAISPPVRLWLCPVLQNAVTLSTGNTLNSHYWSRENSLSFTSWSVNVERQEN